MLDILIKNGTIIDGTGSNPYIGSIGIQGGKIVFAGDADDVPAARVIDAEGLIVSPGFIDIHGHDDLEAIAHPGMAYKLNQGITTTMIGMCGLGPAPYNPEKAAPWERFCSGVICPDAPQWTWRSFGEFLDVVQAASPGVNIIPFVAHGAVRSYVMGLDARTPTETELAKMRELVAQSMDEGAKGLSTGLIYIPMAYADHHELTELCRPVGARGGFVMPHIRSYQDSFLDCVQEFVDISRETGARLHLPHIGARSSRCWPIMDEVFSLLDREAANGNPITFDCHYYDASNTMANALLPPWANAGGIDEITERLKDPAVRARIKEEWATVGKGRDLNWDFSKYLAGWDQVIITTFQNPELNHYVGKSVQAIAEEMKLDDPYDAVFELMIQNHGMMNMVIYGVYSYD